MKYQYISVPWVVSILVDTTTFLDNILQKSVSDRVLKTQIIF